MSRPRKHHHHGYPAINLTKILLDRLSSPDRAFSLSTPHIAAVSDLKFIGDELLVSADVLGRVCLSNYAAPIHPTIAHFPAHSDSINSITAGLNGSFVTAGNDGALRLWDASRFTQRSHSHSHSHGHSHSQSQAEALVQVMAGHSSFVQSCDMIVGNTTQLIASVSLDSTLALWTPSCPHPVFQVSLPTVARSVRFVGADPSLLVTANEDGVFLWDIRSHSSYQVAATKQHYDPVWSTPSSSQSTPAKTHSPATPRSSSTPTTRSAFLFTPSTSRTPARALASPQTPGNETNYPFWNMDWSSSVSKPKKQATSSLHHSQWSSFADEPATARVIANDKFKPAAQLCSANKVVNKKQFDRSLQRFVQQFSDHALLPYAAIAAHASPHVITAADDNKLKLWDVPTQQGAFTFDGCNLSSHAIPVLSSDDKLLICGSSTGSIYFWSTFSGADETMDNSVRSAPTHDHPVTSLALSPDDMTLASGDQFGNIKIRTANNCTLANCKNTPTISYSLF